MNSQRDAESIDIGGLLNYILSSLLKYWYAFAGSTILFVVLAFTYATNESKMFEVNASIVLTEYQSNNRTGPTFMREMEFFESPSNVENAMATLTSSSVLLDVVEKLNLEVSVYTLLYGEDRVDEYPIDINVLSFPREPTYLEFQYLGGKKFSIHTESLNLDSALYEFGEVIRVGDLRVKLSRSGKIERTFKNLGIWIKNPSETAKNIGDRIKVQNGSRFNGVIELSMPYPDPDLGEEIMEGVINSYIKGQFDEKLAKANAAISSIDEELEKTSSRLRSIDTEIENFKVLNGILDLKEESIHTLTQLNRYKRLINEIDLQLGYFDYLEEYLDSGDSSQLISPAASGITDQFLNNIILETNKLINDAIVAGSVVSAKNPQLISIQSRIDNGLKIVGQNFITLEETANIRRRNFAQLLKEAEQSLSEIPATGRKLDILQKEYKLTETLHNYLVRRRSEAEIAAKSEIQSISVINYPLASPKSQYVPFKVFFGFVVGLMIPFGFIFLFYVVRPKRVESQKDIQNLHNDFIHEITFGPGNESVLQESLAIYSSILSKKIANTDPAILLFAGLGDPSKASEIVRILADNFSGSVNKVLVLRLDLEASNQDEISDSRLNFHYLEQYGDKFSCYDIESEVLEFAQSFNRSSWYDRNKLERFFNLCKKHYSLVLIDLPSFKRYERALLFSPFVDSCEVLVELAQTEMSAVKGILKIKERELMASVSLTLIKSSGQARLKR